MREYVFLRKVTGNLECFEVEAPHSGDLISLPDNAGGMAIGEEDVAELIDSIREQLPGNRLHKTPIALCDRFAVFFGEGEAILGFLENQKAV